jgi:hypothetical protein
MNRTQAYFNKTKTIFGRRKFMILLQFRKGGWHAMLTTHLKARILGGVLAAE